MKRIISALAIAIGVVPLAAAPSSADPVHPTYAYLTGYTLENYGLLAVSLSSPDHRCVVNRRVTFQEFDGVDSWITLGSDTTTETEVAAIKAVYTLENFRVTSPQKVLSDGTTCGALVPLPVSPPPLVRHDVAIQSSPNARAIGDKAKLIGLLPAYAKRFVAFGFLDVPKKCRNNRVVRLYRADESGFVPTGRDTTGRSGVFGIGGEMGLSGTDAIKVSLVKKRLPDGSVCGGETYTYGVI